MGILLSRIINTLTKKNARIVMVGLDAAGKTTVLFKIKLNDIVTTIPTIGFNVERVEYKNLHMTIWDIGGQDRLRPLWRHYYEHTNAIIFVVDSCDHARVEIAKNELHKLASEPDLVEAKIVVFANKQDMRGALSAAEMIEALEMKSLRQRWFVQPTSAQTGSGLYEGLDWLASQL